ncbi:MAG: sigma-54 dependent transcriptional regulator [Thermodesulfovibrionales bacterium]
MHRVLVVDDEEKIRKNICEILSLKGFSPIEAPGGREAAELFIGERPAAVLLDVRMPGMDGFETLARLRQIDPSIPVIMITAHGDIPSAVVAVKQGAYDFLCKPPDFDYLVLTLNRAVEKLALERRIMELDAALHTSLESTLGRSESLKKTVAQLPRIAASDFAVLIQGDTGTGKTFLASIIHSLSRRAGGPFVKVSIGSLQDSVVGSELFGHEKGAFTGATRAKKGYFEAAEGGTLFIDDLDTISPFVQGKLLNAIEDKQIFRVGSSVPVSLNLRIIGATNTDLLKSVREGRFREDLFFRLSEVTLQLPPLRERNDDIVFFGRKFFLEACSELGYPARGPACGLSDETVARLREYHWPGNLRQLRNIMKRAALQAQDGTVGPGEIELLIGSFGAQGAPQSGEAPAMTMKDAEKKAIQQALAAVKGQRLKAASLLQIDYKTLVRKMHEYNIVQ